MTEKETKEVARCSICGEPMPEGEGMFMYHGFSGPCPKPAMKRSVPNIEEQISDLNYNFELVDKCGNRLSREKDNYIRQMLLQAEIRGASKSS